HTLDMFFECQVNDVSEIKAMDDAAEYQWIAIKDIHTEQFGLRSIRAGLLKYIKQD
ncbi:MAG TPA: DNA mismatch repair protein MutT, partial [Xylanibacter oryzae]|nr:DNA mismatch repair protein MutT [Xylanibacter oryzae]